VDPHGARIAFGPNRVNPPFDFGARSIRGSSQASPELEQTMPQPFTLRVPDDDIGDLRERLARTRFPDSAPGKPWLYGTDVDYLRSLVDYWRGSFDWRAQEARLNAFPQFKITRPDTDLHFLHVPGKGPNPTPLLLMHGWPGSVFEFLDFIPRLTDPASFGGDPTDAFTVVAPSLPGYGLSFRPGQKRFGVEEIADIFAELMTHTLGYKHFGIQGGDWGGITAARMGYAHAGKLIGIHVNFLAVRREPDLIKNPTPEQQAFIDQLKHWLKEDAAYASIQGTRPQTLSFGLTDSPAGLAAWIVEKFRAWSDCGGDVESVFTRDQMLANISFYWFTGAIGSSFYPYYFRMHRPWMIPDGAAVTAPTAYAEFPKEMLHPPRSLAEPMFTNIRRWTVMKKGGHFAAMEQPEALAEDVRAFYRSLRG
jgi:pimeloyl-ACP methyl ester carboxylesterase